MAPRGVSILARDLQSVVFYDSKGTFIGVRRPDSGKPIEVRCSRSLAAASFACCKPPALYLGAVAGCSLQR